MSLPQQIHRKQPQSPQDISTWPEFLSDGLHFSPKGANLVNFFVACGPRAAEKEGI